MDDKLSNPARAKASLAAALRVARAEDAERSDVIADLRTLAIARLAVLRDALEPVLAQIPAEVDLFDVGLMPGDPPRLFIDMVAFVEMARDRRSFRFFQDRRSGRILMAEAETLDDAVDAITAYLARRLVERDKSLAGPDQKALVSTPAKASRTATSVRSKAGGGEGAPSWGASLKRSWSEAWPATGRRDGWYVAGQIFWFVVEVLGLLALFTLLFFGVRSLILLGFLALPG